MKNFSIVQSLNKCVALGERNKKKPHSNEKHSVGTYKNIREASIRPLIRNGLAVFLCLFLNTCLNYFKKWKDFYRIA